MTHTVGLIHCKEYKVATLLDAISKVVAAINFDTSVLRGKTVLLKPNMLGAYPPDMHITTNPVFVEAAIVFFKELGCHVWVGDSSNGIFNVESVWRHTGILDVCKKLGVIPKMFEKEGAVMKDGILIAKPTLETDFLINLPKFKTHGLTVLTAATKNLFGCVPGLQKTEYHRENIDRVKFARLLVRIAEITKPALNLVDGIVAMEGNGPSGGDLVQMDTIVAGSSHFAVDAVCARLINLKPEDVDTLAVAKEMGLWNDRDEINVVGGSINEFIQPKFALPSTFTKGMRDWWISQFVIEKIWSGLSVKPKIDEAICQRCGLCVKACPVNAIIEDEKKQPRIITKNCVECYCCHEICPNKAIELNESLGIRIGRWMGERRSKRQRSKEAR